MTQAPEYFATMPEEAIDMLLAHFHIEDDPSVSEWGDQLQELGFTVDAPETAAYENPLHATGNPIWLIYPELTGQDLRILHAHYKVTTTIEEYRGYLPGKDASAAMDRAKRTYGFSGFVVWTTAVKGATEGMFVGLRESFDSNGNPSVTFHPIVRWGRQFVTMPMLRSDYESKRVPAAMIVVLADLFAIILAVVFIVFNFDLSVALKLLPGTLIWTPILTTIIVLLVRHRIKYGRQQAIVQRRKLCASKVGQPVGN